MTTIRLNPRMVILAFFVAAMVGVAAFVAQGFFLGAADFQATDFQAGQMASNASDESDSDILVARVGEFPITLAELKEEILHATYMSTIAQRELDGLGPETGLPTKHLESLNGVVTKWGVETASLAKLIQDRALFEKAQELNVAATDDEVSKNLTMARRAYDNEEYDQYNKGYVKSTGEDIYWSDVYPTKAKLSLSISNLQDYIEEKDGATAHRDAKTLWVDFTAAVMDKANIMLPESTHHSTTKSDILDYLSDVRDVERNTLLRESQRLETAPKETWVICAMSEDGTVEKTESSVAAVMCFDEDEQGNVTRWVCDKATEEVRIADLESAVLYMIVEPGNPLPVFDE